MSLPSPLPDDPRKWDGWRLYQSPNYYERLSLSLEENPGTELIEDNTRRMLVWWQKKLPLKNQPSNPLAQLLWDGLDIAPRCLAEARSVLCNPESRRVHDLEVLSITRQRASAEFQRFFHFVTSNGTLTDEGEESLFRFGEKNNLGRSDVESLISAALAAGSVTRISTPEPPPVVAPSAPPTTGEPARTEGNPQEEFKRVLNLSGLDSDTMTDDQRDALINMAENLGVDAGDAEDMVDVYLEEMDALPGGVPTPGAGKTTAVTRSPASPPPAAPKIVSAKPATPVLSSVEERQKYTNFINSLGRQMLLIPSGSFVMGSSDPLAAPNELPLTKVRLTRFYMCRHLVTTADYEKFNPSHRANRPVWADDRHPVVYVNSKDAMKFCEWLSAREKRRYRLPTEAEWEYAARGADGRIYPWGSEANAGHLGNFADCKTHFSWSDPAIDDGHAESSPVGAYPRGASAFGVEDMGGNVWEWCADFFDAYKGGERTNPHGPMNGQKRVYRGGSWRSRFASLRATARGFNDVDYRYNDVGFRVVCECE